MKQSKTGKMLLWGGSGLICVMFFLEFFMFNAQFGTNEVLKLEFQLIVRPKSKTSIALKIRKLSRGHMGSELIY